ncbi:hypothetical protein FI667_g11572, partial [Globisporangium splendens]
MDDETKPATATPTHADRLAAPVYTPLCPPRIDSISHEALVKWRSARKEYEAMVEMWCVGTQEDPDSVRVSVKNSMDLQLLTACCTYKWKIPVDKIDDVRLMKELNKIIDSVKNSTVPDIDKLFESRLRMNLRESDVGARVINYFKLCDDIIQENGLTTIMEGKQGAKEKCKILMRFIDPAALQEAVQLHQRFHDSASKADAVKLFDLVMEKALKQEEMYLQSQPHRQEQKKRPFGRNAPAGIKKTRSEQPRTVESSGDKMRRVEEGKRRKRPHDGAQSMSPRTCLHCGGQHLVRSCPTASSDEKVRLLKEHSAKLRGSFPKRNLRAKKVGSILKESATNPVMMACLNDVELVPYCADSGSDVNLISRAHLEAVKAKDKSVIEYALDKPMVSSTVGGCIQSTHAVELFVTLHTAAGPVRCQDRKLCLVIEGEEEEFIVGKALLRELGIDVNRLLEMLAARRVDSDDDPVSPAETPEPFQVKLDVIEIVNEMVKDAIRKGFPERNKEKLRELCLMYDIWRLVLGNDPPALVDPLEIRLKPGATPYKCRPRTYSPEKSKFLESFNNQLVSIGWVYENPRSRWACPAVPVRKAEGNEYRQRNDYRPVNDMTDTIVGMMPNLHVALEHCRGKKYYSVFDFLKGFWQLPLAKASQEILSYMTDKKIFTPLRVPQGSADAALHFQATVEKVLDELLYKYVLVWVDDLLLFSDSVEELLNVMERVFFLLDQHGLKLSPKKSHLFLTEVKWCGRIISEAGIGHDAERIHALQNLPYPPTAAALQQFVCATNWLRDGLVNYARVIEPLQKRLGAALKGRKRTKVSAARVAIELSVDEKQCFDDVKRLLSHSTVLTYPLPESQMCLLSDASDNGWGLVVTQVANWTPAVPIQAQQHELLICMGGTFKGSQLNWTVLEKEMFPIAHACDKLEYLLLRAQGFKIYCDHRNIVHLFVPGKELKKHVRGKLLRWSTKLLGYCYQIEHIDGVHNIWADLISRWGGVTATRGTNGAEKENDHCTDRPSTANTAAVMNTEADGSGGYHDQPVEAKCTWVGEDRMDTHCQDQSLSAMRAAVVNTEIGGNDSHLGQRKEAMRASAEADRRMEAMRARVEGNCEHVGERQFPCSRAKSAATMSAATGVYGRDQLLEAMSVSETMRVSTGDDVCPESWDDSHDGEQCELVTKRVTAMRAKKLTTTHRRTSTVYIRPLDSDAFVWPTYEEIKRCQNLHRPPSGAEQDDDGTWRVNGRVWIPEEAHDLLERLLVISHCGARGHRGMDVMQNQLKAVFEVVRLAKLVRRFCNECLLCLHVKGGRIIPRPWSETFHAHERNEALHWDFLYLGESFEGNAYLLVLKDAATHYTQLVRCECPTAEVAAQAMLDWYSNFGLAKVWISDCGTHFKNKVIQVLCTRLKAKQDFVLAYCPWCNGTIERVNRDIIQVLKVLILEYKINRRDWPYLLPLVQASLNHSQVASLAHKAPIELFTGLQCPSPLTTILAPSNHEMIVTIDDTSDFVEAKLRNLRESLSAMHLEVKEKKKNQTQYNMDKRKGKPANFSIGDYVLRSRVDERRGLGKLMVTWTGPFRVVEACEYYFVVEHLITKERADVHASRLKFYRDDSLNVTRELIEHVGAQDTLLGVERICSHQYNDNMKSYELLVKWKGFEDIEDSWEPVEAIRADVPDLVKRYVDQSGDRKLQLYHRQSDGRL